LELRDYALRRTRSGANAQFDYRFNQNHEIYLRTIYNSFTDREWRRRYVFVPGEEFGEPANEIERLTKDRFEQQDISSYNLGGRHVLPRFTFDYEVAFAEAFQDTPFDYEVNFIGEPDELTTNFSYSKFPRFSTNPDFDYLDNSNYEFDELEVGNTFAYDQNVTGKFNIGIPYNLAGNSGLIKFGAKYRAKTRKFEVSNNKYEWAGGDITFNGQTGDFTAEKFEGGLVDDRFLDGQYELSAAPDMGKVIRLFNANRNGFELNAEDQLVDEALESYRATEDVLGAYVMTDLQIKKLQLVGGVRFEKTNVAYDYNTVVFDDEGDLDEILPESGTSSYDFFLPQVNARYALSNFTNLRAAAVASYARPNFQSIIPSQEINIQDREAVVGNADLLPVSALNLDVMVDHYFGTVGVLSFGIFHKSLDNFIYRQVTERSNYEGRDFGTDIRFVQEVNGGAARVFGMEFAYQQNLTFLPGALAGLGVYANYTFTTSSAELDGRSEIGSKETIDLPGQSTHVGNFSLGYTIKGFNTRISANYHGAYLDELGEEAEEDRYIKSRLQVDWTANYRVNNRFNVFAEFLNITNAPFEAYQGDKETVVQREFYSWWSRFGIKMTF
jgi:TonB-dependent receptor